MKTGHPNLQDTVKTYLKEKLGILSVYIFKNQRDRKNVKGQKKYDDAPNGIGKTKTNQSQKR